VLEYGISFIGAGNMANAIINSLLAENRFSPDKISVSDPSDSKKDKFNKMGINVVSSNVELAKKNDILILAVKPQVIDSVLNEIAGEVNSVCVVSIAAGVSTPKIRSILGEDTPVIRVLPNTPMLVSEGMTVVAEAPDVDCEIFKYVLNIFKLSGEVLVLPEDKMNEAIPLSSSSPAFFFRFLNAMAHAGEKLGIDYNEALRLSAVAMYGSAKYAMSTDKSLSELIKLVSSPGGTTIAALSAFDEFNFEAFIDDVAVRCVNRAYELGKD